MPCWHNSPFAGRTEEAPTHRHARAARRDPRGGSPRLPLARKSFWGKRKRQVSTLSSTRKAACAIDTTRRWRTIRRCVETCRAKHAEGGRTAGPAVYRHGKRGAMSARDRPRRSSPNAAWQRASWSARWWNLGRACSRRGRTPQHWRAAASRGLARRHGAASRQVSTVRPLPHRHLPSSCPLQRAPGGPEEECHLVHVVVQRGGGAYPRMAARLPAAFYRPAGGPSHLADVVSLVLLLREVGFGRALPAPSPDDPSTPMAPAVPSGVAQVRLLAVRRPRRLVQRLPQ